MPMKVLLDSVWCDDRSFFCRILMIMMMITMMAIFMLMMVMLMVTPRWECLVAAASAPAFSAPPLPQEETDLALDLAFAKMTTTDCGSTDSAAAASRRLK